MIKELVQFTETCLNDEGFKNLGVVPKEGLHIILHLEKTEEQTFIADKATYVRWTKKSKIADAEQNRCSAWAQVAWMVDTNKCLDLPIKAIHSASPYCFAVKRENLENGEKYVANQKEGKSQVYDRINAYFAKSQAFLTDSQHKIDSEAFRIVLNDRTHLHRILEESGMFEEIKDAEYVVFYLDIPVERYSEVSKKYMKEKLFNTSDYNVVDEHDIELLHGTSGHLNGFPTKKPFLLHQSATFDIAGRISSHEAQILFEFNELSRRGLFPRPLPLFVNKSERERTLALLKDSATSADGVAKKGYQEIILELYKDYKGELGNYYLLFQLAGEIKDFDFVSKFEYEFKDEHGKPIQWIVKDIFNVDPKCKFFMQNGALRLDNVFDLQTKILPKMFNNSLVALPKEKEKKGWAFRYFDDIDAQYCDSYNTFLMVMKYRKAFYDYIYKSQRQSVTGENIQEILITLIFEDMKKDDVKKSRYFNIGIKLNFLFNLHSYFSKIHNPIFMATKIEELSQRVNDVAQAKANVHLENNEHFAFAAGQMLGRIYLQMESASKTYKVIEPYLKITEVGKFKESIQDFFLRYSHKPYSERFTNVSSEVMAYEFKGDFKAFRPLILAGVFYRENRKNLLMSIKEVPEVVEDQDTLD
jgi:CRISPR-associated protein Csh1